MRIRTIKPEFFTHEGLFEAEREDGLPLRVAFAGLWCAADRAGRFKWEPRRLGVAILPYDGLDFSRVLHALVTRAFIIRYRVGDAWYGAIPSWSKHQIINNRESASVIPDVSENQELDACPTRAPRVPHADKGEGKGKEGKGKEGKGKGKDIAAASPPRERNLLFDANSGSQSSSPEDEIYAAYPRKVAKQAALKAIRGALLKNSTEKLLTATRAYAAATMLYTPHEIQFVPYPATWFARGSYEDDPEMWKRNGGANPHQRPATTQAEHDAGF